MRMGVRAGIPALWLAVMPVAAAAEEPQRAADPPGASLFLDCKKVPPGKRAVRLHFAKDASLAEVVSFMANLSCAPVAVGPEVPADAKLELSVREMVTARRAYALFTDALTSAGLLIVPQNETLVITRRRAEEPAPIR